MMIPCAGEIVINVSNVTYTASFMSDSFYILFFGWLGLQSITSQSRARRVHCFVKFFIPADHHLLPIRFCPSSSPTTCRYLSLSCYSRRVSFPMEYHVPANYAHDHEGCVAREEAGRSP